jgi:hypothetical protein
MMLRLLLKMLLLSPDLLRTHALGYVDLANEASVRYLGTLKTRWVMYVLSVLTLLLALIFGGVALLLWGTLPLSDAPHPWVLLALPVTCGVLSGLCWCLARTQRLQPLLKDIQAQIALDLQAIRQVHSA